MENYWPWWIAGPALGGTAVFMTAVTGKVLGISSAYAEAAAPLVRRLGGRAGPPGWKLAFAAGLPLGGLAAALARGGVEPTVGVAALEGWLGLGRAGQLGLLFAGGTLVGLGARIAGGCTSGHSIVGVAQGARSSILATIGFMIGGFATAWTLQALLGTALGSGGAP
jgi:uncharacterized membrane protein YedE/YeeE